MFFPSLGTRKGALLIITNTGKVELISKKTKFYMSEKFINQRYV